MIGLLDVKCPHCKQHSINALRVSTTPSRCPECNGLVSRHKTNNVIYLITLGLTCLILFYSDLLAIGIVLIPFELYFLFVPVVVVREEKSDVPKEKKCI